MLKKKEIRENGHVMGANGVSAKNERYEILYIRSDIQENSDMMKSVISLLKFFSGKVPVVFCRSDETGNIARANMGEYRVDACDTLQRELKERFGEDNVKLVSKAMQKQQ